MKTKLAKPQPALGDQEFADQVIAEHDGRPGALLRILEQALDREAQNLLRISCTAAHTARHVARLVETIERVAKRLEWLPYRGSSP